MEFSEKAYENLIKMGVLGKRIYNEERLSKALTSLAWARRALEESQANPYMSMHMEKARQDVEAANATVEYYLAILDGTREDPNITSTMYEIMGYKEKEKADKAFDEYCNRVCPKGYWMPGME